MCAGLGLYEYMLLAEELGAEPVWVVNNGVSHREDIATADIGPWVQVCQHAGLHEYPAGMQYP